MQLIHTFFAFVSGSLPQPKQDVVGIKVATAAEAIGSGTTIFYGMSAFFNEYHNMFYALGVTVGVATGLGGLWMQWHFNKKKSIRESKMKALEAERHELEMKVLRQKLLNLKG